MAKKIMRLTESDLVRLVKKVVKEQYNDNDFEFNTTARNQFGDLEHEHSETHIMLKRKSSRQIKRVLSNLTENIKYLSFLDCEHADFSDINLCEFPKLMFVNVTGTPNNLKETQDDCYQHIGQGLYDFDYD
jgi:glutamate mutase epsilon subunit